MTRHISGYDDRLLTAEILLKDNTVFDERPPTPPRPATPPSADVQFVADKDDGKGGTYSATNSGTGPMPKRLKQKRAGNLTGNEKEGASTLEEAKTDVGIDGGAVGGGGVDTSPTAAHHVARDATLDDVLSHSLDGCGKSLREMFERHLSRDEVMLWWHMPTNPSHNVQCVVAWRAAHQDGPKVPL